LQNNKLIQIKSIWSFVTDNSHGGIICLRTKFCQGWPQINNMDTEWCNTTDNTPPILVSWLSLLALWLFVNTLHFGKTHLLCLKTAGEVSLQTGSPRASLCCQEHLISNLCRCGVLIGRGISEDPDHELVSQTRPYLGHLVQCGPSK
jgi:hypothetical protein